MRLAWRTGLAVGVTALVLLAACTRGSGESTGSATGPAKGENGGRAVGTAVVPGVGTVLVDAEGFTLYYFTPDEAGEPTCTSGCAGTWPPATVSAVPKDTGLPGTLGTTTSPSGGMQLTYEGWPLYTYSGDAEPGQANGQGVGGVWFAMTPDGPSAGASAGGMSNPSGGYGRGGGYGNAGG